MRGLTESDAAGPERSDSEDAEDEAGRRARARRLGLALWLVVAAIVAALFAWKLS